MTLDVRPVDYKTAKLFVETWHYSGCMPKGQIIPFGLYIENSLYALVIFGNGVNPYQAKFLGVDKFFELVRMCRVEPKNENVQLTQFISEAIKRLAQTHEFDCIVAFADPEHGHEGTVYKAANFTRHGETQAEYHLIDSEGNVRHRRYAYRHARRNGITLEESREILGVKRIKTLPKIRYVRFFGKHRKRNTN